MHKGSCLCGAVDYEISGPLDAPVETKISAHIFVGSKAEWYDILDDAPQYEERP